MTIQRAEMQSLEDLVCRVRVMASIANDAINEAEDRCVRGDELIKLMHLVRATDELALEMHTRFLNVLDPGAA